MGRTQYSYSVTNSAPYLALEITDGDAAQAIENAVTQMHPFAAGMYVFAQGVDANAHLVKMQMVQLDAYRVVSTSLVVNEKGQRMTLGALQKRFAATRERAGIPKADFQFRDLRAKAGTDKTDSTGDIRQAQRQLGYRSIQMTETYVRNRRGDKVGPTR